VALGLLHQHYWIRPEPKKPPANSRHAEDKESIKWQYGLDATAKGLEQVPVEQFPRVVHLMDREGDIHEVFVRVLSMGHGAIIRRYRNRAVAEGSGDADDVIRTAPLVARVRRKLPAGHGRKPRQAIVELRSQVMTLTPNNHVERQRRPLRLTMVEVREVNAPAGEKEPIHCSCGPPSRHEPKSRSWPWCVLTHCVGGSRIFTSCGNRVVALNNCDWRRATDWKKHLFFMREWPCDCYVCEIWLEPSRQRHAPKCLRTMNGVRCKPTSQERHPPRRLPCRRSSK
jgi:hypothetical protein